MEHDAFDKMNDVELRVFLRRALETLDEIKHGSNADCEYSYDWVRARCKDALEFACKLCGVETEHTHELSNKGDIHYHPVIPWTKTS